MLMLRRTHERLMAESLARSDAEHLRQISAHEAALHRLALLNGSLIGNLEKVITQLADLADRNAPPPRITSVNQPKSITEADTNAAKKLRGVK